MARAAYDRDRRPEERWRASWPTLLAHFEEPVVTRDGRDAAIAVHDSFADKLRATLALNSDGGHLLAEPKFRALG